MLNRVRKNESEFFKKERILMICVDQNGPACYLESTFLWTASSKLPWLLPETQYFSIFKQPFREYNADSKPILPPACRQASEESFHHSCCP